MLALRLPPELEKRLTDLAARTGRTKSYYARQALIEYIDDMEDVYLAEQRLRDAPEYLTLEESMRSLTVEPEDIAGIPDV